MIESETVETVVGDIHKHVWNGEKCNVRFDGWDSERELTIQEAKTYFEKNDLILKQVGNSGGSFEAIKKRQRYFCTECETEAHFDSDELEYYCPICES